MKVASADSRPRRKTGRPLSFDRQAALEQAMLAFWRHGYETTSIVDLTAEGVQDWVSWGRTDVTSQDRKLAGGNQIEQWTAVGNPNYFGVTPSLVSAQWTDGAGVIAASNPMKIECQCAQGEGFRIQVPADTNQRVLKVYVGLRNAGGRLVAQLSDGSAANFEDTSFVSTNAYEEPIRVYTLIYQAASNGETLTVEWTRDAYAQRRNRVSLLAATLAPYVTTHLNIWDNVTWGSVSWSSVSWSSVSWSSVSWSSDYWEGQQQ